MCLICVDFKAGKLRIDESRKNLNEMGEQLLDHKNEVEKMILDAEDKINAELDEYEKRLVELFSPYDYEDFTIYEDLD
jgi:hypothetical protein|tara:strand:+ start:943 stop:1176 length:234 start_codon:yes stop_codon:yes gene_type:complete